MKLTIFSKLILILISLLCNANSQLFSALTQSNNENSLFGSINNSNNNLKQSASNKQFALNHQLKINHRNSHQIIPQPSISVVSSLFGTKETSNNKPLMTVKKQSTNVSINPNKEKIKINSTANLVNNIEEQSLNSLNVERVGENNIKMMNKYQRIAKRLIKNEGYDIKAIISDWKKVNQKTAEIGNIIHNYYPKLNLTQSNFTEFETLIHKIKDIQKLINSQSAEVRSIEGNLSNYTLILSSKKKREKYFKNAVKIVDEMKIENKLNAPLMKSKKLFTNEINIGDNQISDSIIQFNDYFKFSLNNHDEINISSFINYHKLLRDFKKKCGDNYENCLITDDEIKQTTEKNNLVTKTLGSIKKKLNRLR